MLVFMCSTRYSCQIFIKMEFSQQIFKKYKNIKFHENPSSGSRFYHADRWTDGRADNRTKLTAAFRNFSNAPNNIRDVKMVTQVRHF
jgi:hypothetical protein